MTERTIRLSRDAIVEAVQWWFDTKVRPTTPLTATSFSVGENGTFLF